ncbi:tRNA (adenosine(37)-N6)-threonylcarbamoyltransferase complex dimerization subunit type 1 TsaB [Corynebacterium tapiri]|uniref:tRNA (Adenosine(37)-N6)-threonylcarbamoyltransferase complex dimerization subunit type 1 TsaB n=1 Tax=Corynebacterium tapiri TaxID=1448266 RepID=A0A5C4U5M1_9CORY|nr:tRNA (adenosine(37)-N6)-threonylcarbamoyltransferase complex dimerization subunit type 1 TsaB [Corynebacterium tapiri]TNL98507.1 tRNA (adenosine(37)-N6)-threonylcarbamoyltransferase complex dimerization subunit type 1 TsaB [Corynebacterium tapiri]
MKVLAVDTATSDLVVGVVDSASGEVLGSAVSAATRGHNEQLVPAIDDALDHAGLPMSDLEAIVVGYGPGPFTGLRVGMSTAQALAQALQIPVHGVCTLDALAQAATAEHVLVATDARRKEIYHATYQSGQRIGGPAVCRPEDLELSPDVREILIPSALGDRLPANHVDQREVTLQPQWLVAVADLTADPQPLRPAYLRRPDAVVPTRSPRSAAIPEVSL